MEPNQLKLAVKTVEEEILKKLEAIKVRVLTKTSGDLLQDLQVLTMASDELDDVLLNWDFEVVGSVPMAPSSDDFEEDEFDD